MFTLDRSSDRLGSGDKNDSPQSRHVFASAAIPRATHRAILLFVHPPMVPPAGSLRGVELISMRRAKQGSAHGWRGNTTDDLSCRSTMKTQSLSVGLPRHPWAYFRTVSWFRESVTVSGRDPMRGREKANQN